MSQYSYNSGNNEENLNFFARLDYYVTLQMFNQDDKKEFKFTRDYEEEENASCNSQRRLNILTSSQYIEDRYVRTKKGPANETMMLHMNYKTFTKKHIKKLSLLKRLNPTQLTNCMKYFQDIPSFKNLRSLFQPSFECFELRNGVSAYYNSIKIIKDIMNSNICFEYKIKMIKYIEKMRRFLNQSKESERWKI